MSATAEKVRFDRSVAIAAAKEVCADLQPVCVRLIVAGSLRRLKSSVGDVEILYAPKYETRPDGFFDRVSFNLADEAIAALEKSGVLARRLNVNGSETFGAKNKLLRHTATGVPVDLFQASPECWFNYLVCRTGPATSNILIASRAKDKGWHWKPYSSGFERRGEQRAMSSEREVFEFVGLPYREPWERE